MEYNFVAAMRSTVTVNSYSGILNEVDTILEAEEQKSKSIVTG
jgi:hypothetical protein